MAAPSTTCFTCECGRQYACASLAAARVTKSRCHANHVHDASIRLQRGLITMSNILWVVLSHHGGRHSATALRHQLVQSGVSSTLIWVKQGFRFGDAKQGRRSIKYNQIAMFSFLFRWLPAVSKFLCRTKRAIRAVVYLECTARGTWKHVRDTLPAMSSAPGRPLKWLGYRKFHHAKPQRNRHGNPVVEGSKMLVFTGASMVKVRALWKVHSCLGHLDLWLSKVLSPDYIHIPPVSLTSSCRHTSVCGGSAAGAIKRKKEVPGRLPMKRRKTAR